jgi:hypothetical protein
MNSATLPKSHNPTLVPLRIVSPTPLLGKVNAGLREGILVIGVSLFWALVLILAGFFWLGSGIWGGIETLVDSARRAAHPQISAEKMTKEIVQFVFSCAVMDAQQRLGSPICGRFRQSPNEEERPLIRPQ